MPNKKVIAISAIVIILLTIIGILSDKRAADRNSIKAENITTIEYGESSDYALKEILMDDEINISDQLDDLMKNKKYAEAAACLLYNSDILKDIYNNEQKRNEFCNIHDELMLYGYNKIYYGTISEFSKPQGRGIMLQALEIDAPRYDYAIGNWEGGFLNGEGICGYVYYTDKNASKVKEIKKSGKYINDVLDGDFIYRSVNSDNEISSWIISTNMGITVLNDEWKYDEKKQQYQLPSIEDKSHAYTIPEAEKDDVRWKNQVSY